MAGLQRPAAVMSGGWSKGVKGAGNPPSITAARQRHSDRMLDTNSSTYKQAQQKKRAREMIKQREQAKRSGPYPQSMGYHNAMFNAWYGNHVNGG